MSFAQCIKHLEHIDHSHVGQRFPNTLKSASIHEQGEFLEDLHISVKFRSRQCFSLDVRRHVTSKNVHFLVQKEADAQTTKAKKARDLGTTVIGIPELEKMIEEVSPGLIKSDNETFEDILTGNFDA